MPFELPLNTFTVASAGAVIVASTAFKHLLTKAERKLGGKVPEGYIEARKEFVFDEAFTLVKDFLEKATHYTVEDVQALGNTFVPAPFWVRVVKVHIPVETLNQADDLLVEALGGPEECLKVCGGTEWWRARMGDGRMMGEWISMKSDWQGDHVNGDSDSELEDQENTNSKSRSYSTFFPSPSKLGKQHKRSGVRRKSTPATTSIPNKPTSREKSFATDGGLTDVDSAIETGVGTDVDEGSSINRGKERGGATASEAEAPTGGLHSGKKGKGKAKRGLGLGEEEHGHGHGHEYTEELDELPCMMYVHGGGYYFGSVNTHRYAIWRFARKMGGRAYACYYRLSPQWPFPCALADCLAAYLYLIRPPKGASHRPVDPKKLVLAGDSAGGGLTTSLLCVLRDLSLPLPSGAVLISPWVDLTHSFPSILSSTATDIIPPYGFVHKPSVLWPPPDPEEIGKQRAGVVRELRKRVRESRWGRRATKGEKEQKDKVKKKKSSHHLDSHINVPIDGNENKTSPIHSNVGVDESDAFSSSTEDSQLAGGIFDRLAKTLDERAKEMVEPEAKMKVSLGEVGEDGKEKIVELDGQIQYYATNAQLSYPFVSPVLQPSLGGLPPLLILAGNGEVLRDEIIYLAHRAAHPEKYPLRQPLLDLNKDRTEAAKYYPPTEVHLQVYDDAPHVLPLFSFTKPAKYCYRSIASFCVHVTIKHENRQNRSDTLSPTFSRSRRGSDKSQPQTHLTSSPTLIPGAQLTSPPTSLAIDGNSLSPQPSPPHSVASSRSGGSKISSKHADQSLPDHAIFTTASNVGTRNAGSDSGFSLSKMIMRKRKHRFHRTITPEGSFHSEVNSTPLPEDGSLMTSHSEGSDHHSAHNETTLTVKDDKTLALPRTPRTPSKKGSSLLVEVRKFSKGMSGGTGKEWSDMPEELHETIYSPVWPEHRPSYKDNMIRERVGIRGAVRDLEPEEELPALQLKPEEIGVIKSGPAARYLEGSRLWDSRYGSLYKRIQKRREATVKKATKAEFERLKEKLRAVKVARAKARKERRSRTKANREEDEVKPPPETEVEQEAVEKLSEKGEELLGQPKETGSSPGEQGSRIKRRPPPLDLNSPISTSASTSASAAVSALASIKPDLKLTSPSGADHPAPSSARPQFERMDRMMNREAGGRERPPPSSIAARKDTLDALQLASSLEERHPRFSTLALWNDIQDVDFTISGEGDSTHDFSPKSMVDKVKSRTKSKAEKVGEDDEEKKILVDSEGADMGIEKEGATEGGEGLESGKGIGKAIVEIAGRKMMGQGGVR